MSSELGAQYRVKIYSHARVIFTAAHQRHVHKHRNGWRYKGAVFTAKFDSICHAQRATDGYNHCDHSRPTSRLICRVISPKHATARGKSEKIHAQDARNCHGLANCEHRRARQVNNSRPQHARLQQRARGVDVWGTSPNVSQQFAGPAPVAEKHAAAPQARRSGGAE